jgi:DMSO/TMAO reductase YedYZ molybdopterin-dependent catalytic subunit
MRGANFIRGTMRLLIAGALLLAPVPGLAQSLELVGEKGVTRTLSAAELAALPQSEVIVAEKDGTRIMFRGPTVRSLVNLVGAPAGHEFRGPNMLLAILATATDGYRAAFMLAEVDEGFGNKNAILAISQDGASLPAKDGPYRVIVPGEEHRARWIRMVQRLSLVRVGN